MTSIIKANGRRPQLFRQMDDYIKVFRQMEDDIIFNEMEDNLNYLGSENLVF